MKNILTLIVLLFVSKSFAISNLNCKVDRLSKIFTLSQERIVINESNIDKRRSIASSSNTISARTRYRGKSMEKIMFIQGDKYIIHIEDIHSLNKLNDYMIIKNRKGHEIMFSVACR